VISKKSSTALMAALPAVGRWAALRVATARPRRIVQRYYCSGEEDRFGRSTPQVVMCIGCSPCARGSFLPVRPHFRKPSPETRGFPCVPGIRSPPPAPQAPRLEGRSILFLRSAGRIRRAQVLCHSGLKRRRHGQITGIADICFNTRSSPSTTATERLALIVFLRPPHWQSALFPA
jgi:hypothetical protein